MFSPLGVVRGPTYPYNELWQLRLTEGPTASGRRFSITDSWMSAGAHTPLTEEWTGMTTFFSKKRGGYGKDTLNLHAPELNSLPDGIRLPTFGINSNVMTGGEHQEWNIGDVVDVDGHGQATISGVGCCGYKGLFEISYSDGTKFHVRGDKCVKVVSGKHQEKCKAVRDSRWADVGDD